MISDWGLMQDEKGLLLNYYGPSTFTGRLQSGNLVTLKQTTDYPVHGVVTIGVDVPKPEAFELALRIPGWSWNTALTVNGEAITGIVPGTYQRIARTWKAGDTIVLTLDFGVRTWAGDKECAGKVSVFRGPIVYAYDGRYNKLNPGELPVIEATHVNLEPLPYDGALAPWSLMKLNTWEGASYTVVDLSSAGQTGNHYRTWLPAKNATPSPFSIDRPVDGVCAQRVSWQAAAGAERYTVTMSQTLGDPWATNVETTTTDASNLNLTPGEWYIHVIANNANGFTRAANGPIKVTVK